MSKLFTSTLAALATAGALISAPVFAQQATTTPIVVAANQSDTAKTTADKSTRIELPDRSEWMDIKQVYETLNKAGYKDIRSINSSRHGYKAYAMDANDKMVRLNIHPTEGTVTPLESRRKQGKDGKHKSHRNHGKGCDA